MLILLFSTDALLYCKPSGPPFHWQCKHSPSSPTLLWMPGWMSTKQKYIQSLYSNLSCLNSWHFESESHILASLECKFPTSVEDCTSQWSFVSASSPFCMILLNLTEAPTQENLPLPPSKSKAKSVFGQEFGGWFVGLIFLTVLPKIKLIILTWKTSNINVKCK